MLEGLVAGLLNRFLGMYVKNFDPTQLKVGIWSGDVKLRNLELRREALDQLKLPINVVEGHLGELTLVIPWSNLRGAPVKVLLENVFLLASPKEEAQYDEEEEERRRQRLKMERLDSVELLKESNREGMSQEEQKKNQSFTESLVTKIVDNLQVTVRNIHIRYEDSISAPGHPFALGLTLDEFSAVSTDGQWNPTFIQDSADTTHKLATLGALAVYWNTDSDLFGTGREADDSSDRRQLTNEQMVERFRSMVGRPDSAASPNHQFILKPVSGQAKIEIDKTGDVHAPRLKANLLFEEIGLVLDDHQYRDALMMVDLFHYFIRHQEYKALQPKDVRPKEDPRAWFRFAANAVLGQIHDRNRKWSWGYFRERRDDRNRYIDLFKKKKQQQQLNADEADDLTKLESKLSYEDLRFWRSLARNHLKKENAAALRKQSAQQDQGWLGWMWGSKPQGTVEENEENTQMTEEQRKELYDMIDWDEKAALAKEIDVPREAVKLCVEASLSTGSFTLRQNPHGKTRDLLSFHFDVFKAKALQRQDSMLAVVSLGGLRVNDGTTPGSLYPEIVRVKGAPDGKRRRRLSLVELETTRDEPFFQFEVEKNPIEREGDIAVVGRLKPLEVVWNPNLIVGVVDFFRPPDTQMESITALMETAGATVEGFREQTRAGLVFALEEHRTINAELDLQAPLIIVPVSITAEDSTCLIVDAGHIHVNSQLVDQITMKEIQSKQRQSSTDEDFKRLESAMYDKFIVNLTSTQVLIGPSIAETKAHLINKGDGTHLHVVEQINVDFVVETCILPKAPNLTRFKVSGHLPMLHATVSDTKYKNLMKIIDVAIPKLGNEAQHGGVPESQVEQSQRYSLASQASNKSRQTPRERRQSSAFPFMQPPTAVILDDLDDDDDDDDFEDAKNGPEGDNLRIQQRNFEFNFKVDTLKGSLYRSDADRRKPDTLLVELVAERFDLTFYTRPFDMAADISLGAVTVEDFVDNPSGEFKSIVSSGDSDDLQAGRSLVHVKFVRVNRQSPEFMPVYEGVETNITVVVSTINVIVTRSTLLTLLDFILITFAAGDNEKDPEQTRPPLLGPDGVDNAASDDAAVEPLHPDANVGSIRVKCDLKSIRLILNNDGIRLATLSFNQAYAGIFLRGRSMRISARLGDLSLVDDVNSGVSEDSNLRRLVTIQGDDLADFRYETFDPSNEKAYPGYDSSVHLRAGSVKVNFVEEPFRKIIGFLVKFGKMQALYNAARQAAVSRANQIQQSPSRFKFDVIVKTPIVVFPRSMTPGQPKRDVITAYLGEIYAQNKFAPLDDSKDAEVAMKISTGIRNVRLTSDFHYDGDKSEELEMIDHVDLGFDITYAEHKEGAQRPDTEVCGSLSDIKLRLTQHQLRFLVEISKSVPAVFVGEDNEGDGDTARVTDESKIQHVSSPAGDGSGEQHLMDLPPELVSVSNARTKLDVLFNASTVGLELIMAREDEPVGDLTASSLSRFSLDDTKVKTRMLTDGALEAELLIRSFTIYDSRPRDTNKFRRIMTSSNKEAQQLMASVTISGGKERSLVAMATVDSPRVIFALDYLFALSKFATEGLVVENLSPMDGESLLETPDESDSESEATLSDTRSGRSQSQASRQRSDKSSGKLQKPGEDSIMSVAFRVNLVDAQVILIANPLSSGSEAIALSIRQMVLSKQNAITFQISQIAMFLCRMDKFETSRLRIIDDFSIQLNMDTSQQTMMSIHIDVEPLILRLSLRDILLVLQIVSRAGELSAAETKGSSSSPGEEKARQQRNASFKNKSPSGHGKPTIARAKGTKSVTTLVPKESQPSQPPPPAKREELSATVEGVRVVLIGDLHELPILDFGIKDFTATAENWSTNLKADAAIDLYSNVYNFSKSSWEPLLEPWQVGFGVAKESVSGLLSVDVASKKTFDITLTTATIALASKSLDFLTTEKDILEKPRGVEAPYRVRNYTGFEVELLSKSPSSDEPLTLRLQDGQDAPWSFETWEKMRESLLTETNQNDVGIRLEGSGFDLVKNVRFNREGEFLYSLRPKAENVTHRMCVEVSLGSDYVKYVTLRSPLVVENATQIPVELGIYDAQTGHLLKIEKIAPGDSRPAPVGAVYEKQALVRPDGGFGYQWSRDHLWWRDLLRNPTQQLVCKGENGDPFYFQAHAQIEKANPMAKIYPSMRIKLSAPITLENLLPYDFKYRIYDKNTKKDWSNFLRKGGVSPVHVVELSHLLLLSIDMQDTVFKPSDFSIINSGNSDDFRKESRIVVKDEQGLPLNLSLHYYRMPNCGGAFKITVYSPYVVLNKTGLDLRVRAKSFLQQAKAAAGQFPLVDTSNQERPKALPFMFSYGNDDHRNRALLKVDESEWSKPQSFDAIGSTSEVVLTSTSKQREIHVGITVKSGDGKYKMTKVITLAPRFVLENKLGEEILVRESSSSGYMTLKPGALQPLHFMQKSPVKQLCLCHPGVDNHWTSPFNIADIGITHVKIAKAGQRQRLVRVEILLEDATVFLNLSMETNNWPFSMRNESDTEFTFYQRNPSVDEDDMEDRSGWRPIRYRLPPRSIMPYAWDFPAAKLRELVIVTNRKERHVKLAEIGNQIPMKVTGADGQQKFIDINVAADGPTQTLILSNFRASKSLYRPKTLSRTSTGPEAFEVKDQDTGATFRAQLRLSGVGISLINSQLKELAYITFRDVQLRFSDSPVIQTVSLAVKWMQIDNQLYGGIFPMILYPSVVPKKANEVDAHPSLHAMVSRVKDNSYGVLYIKYATVLLQQMTVDLDEDFVFALMEFSNVPGASWTDVESEGKLCDEDLDIPEPSQQQSGQDMYFEVLNIQPMQLDLSFMRTERVNAEDKTSSRNPIMFFLNVMTMAIGNVNDAPIRFNALILDNMRVSTPVLIQNVSSHYSQEVMYQLHKILGSADFLGNPVGLFNNISSGVTDIFYEPYQGLILSDRPEEFGLGIAKGAASFAKKTVFGFSDSFSKFTGSLSKGIAAASLDKQFQDRRRITRARNRPKHALYGVTAGANSLFTSVASGEGAVGFFKGVGKGVLGLATKPAVGLLDMASNLDRTRFPRFIPGDGIVRPYNPREALGQYWLKQVDNGKYFDEQYIGHLELPKEDMVTIAKERTGVSLTLRGGANGPFIPVGGGSERGFLYKMVGVAVEEFNRRFRGGE
ncbi:vacuolar protein sorting-associated protein vps13 [Drechmeria coniospora]|uniref:Vacuolar protein sorting-associated protein n=1 Tax=Drechmeria coniospora TaxID=98403 RepID=A0A151GAY7_DRECN|nr:vacuolar protein sorting-associated protein vps13 [Drechmeria coniospora]KYK54262.1 vacuolar protein sorting-associated protein vps13 [Drechmeria coniospora]